MVQKLIILGCGGNALDLLDIVDAINRVTPTWQVDGFLDDRREQDSEYLGLRVLGRLPDARRFEDCLLASTIWNEITFRNLHQVLASTHVDRSRFATLVHPGASVSARARFGQGVIVNFGASIAGNVTIDDHVSIGPGCIVGHDSIIDSYTCVAAGAVISGGVHVQRNCFVGSGAMVLQRIRIGEKALVGLGAVVVKDVDALATVVGNPAHTISQCPFLTDETVGVLK